MTPSFGKRFLMGMLSGAGSIFIKHVLNILLLPVLIHILGIELFSLYMMLVGIQELVLLLDMGFTDALVRLLSSTHGRQDHLAYNSTLKMGHVLFGSLSVLILIVGLGMLPFFPQLFHLNNSLHHLALFALTFIVIEAVLTLYVTYYRGILLSHCLHQWNNVGDTLFHIVGIGLGVGLLIAGYGLMGLVIARLLGAILRAAVVIGKALQTDSHIIWPDAPLRKEQFKEMLSLTFHAMMVNLSIIISHKIDMFIIAFFLPLTMVGFYEMVFRLLGSALQLCVRLCEGVFPLFARIAAESRENPSDDHRARQLFLRMSGFNQFLMGSILLIAVYFYPELFAFFSAGRMPIEPTFPIIAVAIPIMWSSALQIPAAYFLYTSGRENYLTKSSILTAVCNLALSLLLVKPFGITGVALGTLIPQVIQHQCSLIYESCRALKISLKDYLFHVHLKGGIIIGLMFLLITLLQPLTSASSHPLVGIAGVSSLTFALSALVWFQWTASTHEKIFFDLHIVLPFKQKLNSIPYGKYLKGLLYG